ncbi:MAG: DUF11 domain-containing protein [Pedobacter sp.]|nr:MAG: DUF11 domain-containing protein [Pedobacter sp.]
MRIRFQTFLLLAFLLFFAKGYGQTVSSGQQTITITKGSSVFLRANSAGASTYIWFKDGVLINNQNKQTLITATAGVYKVASVNNLGCTSDISEEILVVVKDLIYADVAITKRSVSKKVFSGEVFDYYLNVRNNGVNDASGVLVKDVLPANLTYVGLSVPTNGKANFDPSTKTINWNMEALPNGAFAELIVKVTANQIGLVSNTASVSANEFDPNLLNNISTDQKEVSGLRIPNVFTPNGDGKNETFYLENLTSFDFNDITIINRWGSTVYQSKDYKNDWAAPGYFF